MLMAWRAPISFSEFALVFMGWRIPTREAPTASPKSMPISGAKNEPSGHGKVLLREQQKDQQMWKHSAVHCQILKRANVQLFQRHLYTHRLCELQLAASQKCLHFAETCTLILVFGGGNGGRPGLSRALEPDLGSKVALDGFYFYLSQRRGSFWT